MLYIGIDLGTSETKCLIVSPEGNALARATIPVSCELQPGGIAELNPEMWWESARDAVRETFSQMPMSFDRAALSISSQGLSFILLNAADLPLGPAISTLDARASKEATDLLEVVSAENLFALTGKRANPYYVLPKLLWLKRHRADDFRAAKRFALAMDYLVSRLTGKPSPTDHVLASGTALHDIHQLSWLDQLIDSFGLERSIFPSLAYAGTAVGELTHQAAEEFGLPQKTVVGLGSQDQKCAALAAGLRENVSTISLGTAGALEFITARPILDSERRLPCFPYVQSHSWVLEGAVPTAGEAVRWFLRTLSSDSPQTTFPRLEAEARDADWKATPFFLPHLRGAGSPHWEPSAQGVFWGLSLTTGRGEMFRSILEGICFEFKANLAVAAELGLHPLSIRVFGGGARNNFWLQLLADVLELPVHKLALTDAAAYGACLLAGKASEQEIADASLPAVEEVFEPNPSGSAIAKERLLKFLGVQEKTLGLHVLP